MMVDELWSSEGHRSIWRHRLGHTTAGARRDAVRNIIKVRTYCMSRMNEAEDTKVMGGR